MPTYQYRCAACEDRFDVFQKFADDPLTECPACGGTVRRVIQPVGVVFKGTGWYINDSRKKSSEPGDSPSKSGESSPESTETASKTSESKSVGTTASKDSSAGKESTDAKPAGKKESKAASAAD